MKCFPADPADFRRKNILRFSACSAGNKKSLLANHQTVKGFL
jgi:hypothetical protein